MVYKCEGGGTFFTVSDEAGKMVCSVLAMGSEKNGYMVRIIDPSGKFSVCPLNDLDDKLPAIAQLPSIDPDVREAISCGLHDIKNGFSTISFTFAQHTEDDRAIDDDPQPQLE